MKLTSLTLRSWNTLPNELKIEVEQNDGTSQEYQVVPSEEIFAALLDVVRVEITNSVSKLFEGLTGSEEEPTIIEAAQEAFLDTDEGAYPEDDGPEVKSNDEELAALEADRK